MSLKRPRCNDEIPVEEQLTSKKAKIINKFIETIDNSNKEICSSKNIKINTINIDVDVGQYNVKIYHGFGSSKYICSCTPFGIYNNFSSNYCKHITYALSEIVKDYVNENKKFFTEKKNELLLRENIEFLKSSIKNINIHDKK